MLSKGHIVGRINADIPRPQQTEAIKNWTEIDPKQNTFKPIQMKAYWGWPNTEVRGEQSVTERATPEVNP